MPRKPIGDKPMTPAERQARSRKVKAALTAKEAAARKRKADRARHADPRTMTQRWDDAVSVLTGIQLECAYPANLGFMRRPNTFAVIIALDLSALVGAATER